MGAADDCSKCACLMDAAIMLCQPCLVTAQGARCCGMPVQVCRLFDLFLATHPLMPLYVGAAAMHSQRQQLLAADEMPILHSKLVNLSVTKMATADQLAIQVRQSLWAASEKLMGCAGVPRQGQSTAPEILDTSRRGMASAQQCNDRQVHACSVCLLGCVYAGYQAVQAGHTRVHHCVQAVAAAAVHNAVRGTARWGVALP